MKSLPLGNMHNYIHQNCANESILMLKSKEMAACIIIFSSTENKTKIKRLSYDFQHLKKTQGNCHYIMPVFSIQRKLSKLKLTHLYPSRLSNTDSRNNSNISIIKVFLFLSF